jgi:hypothetical protein
MDPTLFLKLFRQDDRELAAQSISIVGYPVDPSVASGVLHWHLFLSLQGGHHVSVDMPPVGADGRTGVLIMRSLEGTSDGGEPVAKFSREAEQSDTTAQAVLDLLIARGRNKYRYTDDGSGCRYWCEVVLGDLEEMGLVAKGSGAEFATLVEERSKDQPGRYPWPTRKGMFY